MGLTATARQRAEFDAPSVLREISDVYTDANDLRARACAAFGDVFAANVVREYTLTSLHAARAAVAHMISLEVKPARVIANAFAHILNVNSLA